MGMARQFSAALLGKVLEGIWHTGVIVHGKEFYWGGMLQEDIPGQTPYGTPTKVVDLGETHVPYEIVKEYITSVSDRYTISTYSLLSNNCNNFSNELCQFLTGNNIPSDILNLPEEALNSPMGQMFKPFILQMEASVKQNVYNHHPIHDPSSLQSFPFGPMLGNQQQQSVPPTFPFNFMQPPSTSTPFTNPIPSTSTPKPTTVPSSATPTKTTASPAPSPKPQQPSTVPVNAPKRIEDLVHIRKDNKPLVSNQGLSPNIVQKLKQQLPDHSKGIDELQTYLSDPNSENDASMRPSNEVFAVFEHAFATLKLNELFSCLYLFRLFILKRAALNFYVKEDSKGAIDKVLTFAAPEASKTVHTMALTALSNMFSFPVGSNFMVDKARVASIVAKATHSLLNSPEPAVKQIAAALLYNISLFLEKDGSEAVVHAVSGVLDFVEKFVSVKSTDPAEIDTLTRALTSLGNVLLDNKTACALVKDLDFHSVAQELLKLPNEQIVKITSEVLFVANL
eukprot:CAMPEP_0168548118 /NCGR_PEP_ID=MMETSP0413-20121227/4393_1 /TAXON_ID=136452 /ORGANISM="Filamoeba nolandi, Strain NC-AS-23-1" /LENGTH=508 /DNA_ID=CAMNT_0008578405 /DNA_START=129 /DNA_END=1655 /DNA_ORIENTATION=-